MELDHSNKQNIIYLMTFTDSTIESDKHYIYYHRRRFYFAFKIISRCKPEDRILEIGPWVLTQWAREVYKNVYTLGFFDEKLGIQNKVKHYQYDLFNLPDESTWVIPPHQYDMVVACEVIEHLNVGMNTVFRYLHTLTKPGGCVLIQTPNAVALKKRCAMAVGVNPFDLIPDRRTFSEHVREYTIHELTEFAERNGFIVSEKYIKNYFSYDHSLKAKAYEILSKPLPDSFKDGITMVLSKT
jgi:cyclopropane fatty-acyl-phospholipid synthase-like methyltransferase